MNIREWQKIDTIFQKIGIEENKKDLKLLKELKESLDETGEPKITVILKKHIKLTEQRIATRFDNLD